MYFSLVDRVLEAGAERAVTLKTVSRAEEYLQDHFPSYPVLPGVMMLEAMVQASRQVAKVRLGSAGERLVLGEVRALKYNRFVEPGYAIMTTADVHKSDGDTLSFKCRVELIDPASAQSDQQRIVAASGRITLRPVRVEKPTLRID